MSAGDMFMMIFFKWNFISIVLKCRSDAKVTLLYDIVEQTYLMIASTVININFNSDGVSLYSKYSIAINRTKYLIWFET